MFIFYLNTVHKYAFFNCEQCSRKELDMFKTLRTIFLGKAARAEQDLETANAAIIIEQKIREAEAGHATAKRGLASLITRSKSENKALIVLENRTTPSPPLPAFT